MSLGDFSSMNAWVKNSSEKCWLNHFGVIYLGWIVLVKDLVWLGVRGVG